MTATFFTQALVLGLSLSGFYLLMALGLSLMFGTLGIINMAHGVVYMLAGFVVFYLCTSAGLNFYLSLAVTMATLGLAGVLMERTIFRFTGGAFAAFIVISIGFMVLLQSVGYLVFGEVARGMPAPIAGYSSLLGIDVSNYRLVALLITAVLVAGVYYLINKTKLGLAMRATEEDKVAATLQGVNPNRINAFVFLIGFGLAAAAGGLMAPIYALTPTIGTLPMTKAFMIIILGGMGSVTGCIVGAIIIGLADTFLSATIGTELGYIVAWAFIIVLLMFRPRGLLGAY